MEALKSLRSFTSTRRSFSEQEKFRDAASPNNFHDLEVCLEREMVTAVSLLEGVHGQPQAVLFSDRLRAYGVQHALQVAIGALIGLARVNLVLVEMGSARKLPATEAERQYFDEFSVAESLPNTELLDLVGKECCIPDDLTLQLKHLARFYDHLVHRPWEVNPDIVYAIIQNHLGDFQQFGVEIMNYWH